MCYCVMFSESVLCSPHCASTIVYLHHCLFFQDPAIATSKRVGNTSYESYDRGTAKNAWVFESDGKTPLFGEVRCFTLGPWQHVCIIFY